MIFRKCFWLLIVLMLCCDSGTIACATETNSTQTAEQIDRQAIIEDELGKLDMQELNNVISRLNEDAGEYMPRLDLREMITGLLSGQISFDFKQILQGACQYLFHEVLANSQLLGQLIVLAVVAAVLQNLQGSFESGTVGKVAYSVCYLVLVVLAISSFTVALNTGKAAIDNMVDFMLALIPILLTILASMGALTSAALFHPVIFMIVNFIGSLMQNVIFPLIFVATVLFLVNNISDQFKVSRLAALVKNVSIGLLGFFFTIFLGVTSIYGVTASVSDGIALKTAKFASSNFVPIIGKMFADALDVVAGCSLLLKNALGLLGVVAIFFICAFPVLKIISFVVVYKLAGALIQPIGDSRIVECLNSMGNSMVMVFISVITVGLMFFIALTIIVGAGNITAMMR